MTNLIGTDVSFWEDDNSTPKGIDFQKMKAAGAGFTFVKVGQRDFIDQDYATNWNAAKEAGLPRGAFWFYDSREDPIKQAEKFIEALSWDLGELPIFVDFEDEYKGAFQGWENWLKCLTRIRELAGSHEIGIYTAYYYWNENVPVAKQDLFKDYPLWIARYEESPLIPAPWNTWLFWQYTDKGNGKLYGAESSTIDLNYFNGDSQAFHDRFNISGSTPPGPVEVVIHSHTGIDVHVIQRFGSKCIVHMIDLSKVRVYVTPGGFQTVGAAVKKYAAQVGVNGGGWPNVQTAGHRSNEIWASDGTVIQATAIDNRGYINVLSKDLMKAIIHQNSQIVEALWNAWGFDRILGSGGVFNDKISDKVTKDARTGTGLTADGRTLILLSAEGNDIYQHGLSFPEMWEVLHEFGAVIAGNNDGGSSSAVHNTAISDESLIIPSDGLGKEANVINHVLVFASGENPVPPIDPPTPGGNMARYKVLIAVKPRPNPEIAGGTKPNVPAGTEFDSNTEAPGLPAGTTFVQMPTGDWLPLIYAGEEYVRKISDAPVPGTPTLTHTIQIYSDGSMVIDGKPYA